MKIANLKINFETGLTILFLVLFSLGQLQRWQITPRAALYWHDLLIVCFVAWQLVNSKKIIPSKQKLIEFWKKITKAHSLELIFLGWMMLGMVIGLLSGRLAMTSLLYLSRLLAYSVFTYSLINNKKINFSPRNGFLIAGLLIALWGLLQYLFLPDTRFLSLFGWDNHYYRLIGTMFDPAFMGIILTMTWGFWQQHHLKMISDKTKNIISFLLLIAIAATFSRATYLAWGALALLLTINKLISKKQLLISSLILITTVLLLPKPGGEGVNLARHSTAEARYRNAQEGLIKLEGTQWLWGRGLFNTDSQQEKYATPDHAQLPDSLPVLILNSSGIVGLLLSLLIADKWIKIWWKKDPLWTSILLAILLHSFFNNTLLQPFVFLYLWGSRKN